MNGLENIIIGLWLLPVTLFIIIPLGMLVAWLSYQLVRPLTESRSRMAEETSGRTVDSAVYSKA